MMKMSKFYVGFFVLVTFVFGQISEDQGVYEYVLKNMSDSIVEAVPALAESLRQNGFHLSAVHDVKGGTECDYEAAVLICYDSLYVTELNKANPSTAAFAFLDRINVFQDEDGLHVSIVNPLNINRTILMEDEKYTVMSDKHRQKLRTVILSGLHGQISEQQYGEIRDEGYIGRTMGIMAGGDFDGKIGVIYTAPAENYKMIMDKLKAGLSSPGEDWQLQAVCSTEIPFLNTTIIGMSSQKMEMKSFDIVQEGNIDSREDFKCPGLAHAAAYPIELVVRIDNDKVKIKLLNIMYRMKMYFEDAGMMAFAANMTMPGALEDEIKDMVERVLNSEE